MNLQQQRQQQQVARSNNPHKRATPAYDPLDPSSQNYNQVREGLRAIPEANIQSQRLELHQKEAERKYLDEIASRDGVYRLKSGLMVEILEESSAPNLTSPNEDDSCRVKYLGTFINGTKFDENVSSFSPNQVIDGWTEALQYMAEGDKWRLHVPFALGYGGM